MSFTAISLFAIIAVERFWPERKVFPLYIKLTADNIEYAKGKELINFLVPQKYIYFEWYKE